MEAALGVESMEYFARIKEKWMEAPPVDIGSNWPIIGIIDANPLRMLQVLVTRKNPYEKNTDEPLGNTISLEYVIHVMTLGGAYSMRKENKIGSIGKGKNADMIILDQNLLKSTLIQSLIARLFTQSLRKIVYNAKMPE